MDLLSHKQELSDLHTAVLCREIRDLIAIRNLQEINNADTGGYWITTEAGNHLYISDSGEMKTGPTGKTVGYTKESSTGQVIAQAKHGQHMPESSYKRSATDESHGIQGSAHGTIGSEGSITIKNEKSASGGNQWRYTTLEAREVGEGHIELGSPKNTQYDQVNRNTLVSTHTINAGIYNEPGARS